MAPLPDDVVAQYGGGFIGLLRPGLYERMLRALPAGALSVDHRVTGLRESSRLMPAR